MVFASTCERASSAFICASRSRDQICLVSSEHFVIWLTPFWTNPSTLQPIVPCWQWCQYTSGSFAWASLRFTRWTFKEIQSFLIRHCEHTLYHRKKSKVTTLLSVVTRKVFGYISLTSISSFGFDDWQTDWMKRFNAEVLFTGGFYDLTNSSHRVLTSSEGRIVNSNTPHASRLLSTFMGSFREELLRASDSIKRQQNMDACFQKYS